MFGTTRNHLEFSFLNSVNICGGREYFDKWIYIDIRRNRELRQPHDVSNGALLRVLYLWYPKSRTLPSLLKAIELRHDEQKIFPIDLISRCADTIDISDQFQYIETSLV